MKNEEAKQQAIINAYGEYWGQVKKYVDEYGWCKYQLNEQGKLINGFNINSHIICEYNNFKQDNAKLIYFVRPLSLQGIENNNGWIKIESENDLPKDENIIDFWVFDGEEIVIAKFIHESQTWWDKLDLNFRLFPSHYQKIIKPKPPIY